MDRILAKYKFPKLTKEEIKNQQPITLKRLRISNLKIFAQGKHQSRQMFQVDINPSNYYVFLSLVAIAKGQGQKRSDSQHNKARKRNKYRLIEKEEINSPFSDDMIVHIESSKES